MCDCTRRGRCLRRAYYLLYSFGSKTNKRLRERAGGKLHARWIKRLDGGGDVPVMGRGCVCVGGGQPRVRAGDGLMAEDWMPHALKKK